MTPLDYLFEAFKSVKTTLSETLRYEYGLNHSNDYFKECSDRLADLEKELLLIQPHDQQTIATRLFEIENLGMYIAHIERSHLGEFSWPFADHIRKIASLFLSEPLLNGKMLEPIINIVAEGSGYQIINEPRIPATTGRRRLAVIKFPRQFKEHVLLHTLFGHELGHTTVFTTATGNSVKRTVAVPLIRGSAIDSPASITTWLFRNDAPQEIKDALLNYNSLTKTLFVFPNQSLEPWYMEFICDLFGLLLFGPCFMAAHKALILSSYSNPYLLTLSHPPYAVRHKMLVQASRILGWDKPVLSSSKKEAYSAEVEFYDYILDDPYSGWSDIFPSANLTDAVNGIRSILNPFNIEYSQPADDDLFTMIDRLQNGIPPLNDTLDAKGNPVLSNLPVAHILYSGWVYWLGRTNFKTGLPLTFSHTNGLCNQALVQQTAIDYMLA